MSVVKFVPKVDAKKEELVNRLKQEYLAPSAGEVEPLLIELDDKRRSSTIHLYVIWEDWARIDQQARTEIIVEAYEAARGTQQALRVTIAMGLTKAEAKRMGIEYAVEQPAA